MSYDSSNPTADTTSEIRLLIGAIDPENGILPNDRDFSDEEIEAAYTSESSVEAAAVRLLLIAANMWRSAAVRIKSGPLFVDYSKLADGFQKSAEKMADSYGIGTPLVSYTPIKDDGYRDEYSTSASE